MVVLLPFRSNSFSKPFSINTQFSRSKLWSTFCTCLNHLERELETSKNVSLCPIGTGNNLGRVKGDPITASGFKWTDLCEQRSAGGIFLSHWNMQCLSVFMLKWIMKCINRVRIRCTRYKNRQNKAHGFGNLVMYGTFTVKWMDSSNLGY